MKSAKRLTIFIVAVLPFLASCMSPTEKIACGLDKRTLTTAEAQYAIADGAEISADFLEKAAKQGQIDLVKLFVSKGANPWEMKSGTKTFSLFDYAVHDGALAYLKICLDVKDRYPELAEKKATAYVESVIAKLSVESSSDSVSFDMSFCAQIWGAGLALPAKSKMKAEQKRIADEKVERERQASLERERLEKERIERERQATIERERLEKERIERERHVREEHERLEKERREKTKKFIIREGLANRIFYSEKKLTEEECSRGWSLLEVFGEEQMPALTNCCKESRTVFLEAEANLVELVKALLSENIDLETNEVFQEAGNRWLDLAADYWYLRYKLTDFYSLFKIGAVTSEELAAKDAEFAEE